MTNIDTGNRPVYSYRGFDVFQTRDSKGDLLPAVVLKKGDQEVEVEINNHASILKCIHIIKKEINKIEHATTCVRCNERAVHVTPEGVVRKLCSQCFCVALSKLPNPDCEYCLGMGEYFWHSDDCTNDLCTLAGAGDDCVGQIVDCSCTIFDGLGITVKER